MNAIEQPAAAPAGGDDAPGPPPRTTWIQRLSQVGVSPGSFLLHALSYALLSDFVRGLGAAVGVWDADPKGSVFWDTGPQWLDHAIAVIGLALVLAPLKRGRIVLQTQEVDRRVVSGALPRSKTIWGCIQNLWRDQGWKTLWRGHMALICVNIISLISGAAQVQFIGLPVPLSFRQKTDVEWFKNAHFPANGDAPRYEMPDVNVAVQYMFLAYIVALVLAVVTEACVYPFRMIHTRLDSGMLPCLPACLPA